MVFVNDFEQYIPDVSKNFTFNFYLLRNIKLELDQSYFEQISY